MTLIFGFGGWLVLVLIGLLAPAMLPPNPTVNDVTMNSLAQMPELQQQFNELDALRRSNNALLYGAQTGIPELDQAVRSMAQTSDIGYEQMGQAINSARSLGQQTVPVRETVTVFGLVLGVLGIIQAISSLLVGLVLWVIAGFLNDKLQQKVQADEARGAAYFMQQYGQHRFPPISDTTLSGRDYDRARNGIWADSPPPSRHWSPPHGTDPPPVVEPTPLDQYLRRSQKQPDSNRTKPSRTGRT